MRWIMMGRHYNPAMKSLLLTVGALALFSLATVSAVAQLSQPKTAAGFAAATFTDPWGTTIEPAEGLCSF
jgi:hypothetical protein